MAMNFTDKQLGIGLIIALILGWLPLGSFMSFIGWALVVIIALLLIFK